MISRYRISINGIEMDSLDDNLLILDVSNPQPERTRRKTTAANLDGYELTETYVEQQTVTVTFELHIYDTAERNRVLQLVNDWAAAGGILILNDRIGQHLENVYCDQFASMESVRNWTDPLTLVFSTTTNPRWVSDEMITRSLTGRSASGTLAVDGNDGYSLVSVDITANAAVTSVQIGCGNTVLKIQNINLANGQKLNIDYVKGRYLRIRANGVSVMDKLSADSSDNLRAECGKVSTVSVIANNKVTAMFTARGCWR